MKTRAVRLYGPSDLRLEEFDLPDLQEDEILASVISDSLCMSTYKAAIQGTRHKRIPDDIASKPIITGHEFAGEIVKVGQKWKNIYQAGERFTLQPNINYLNKGYAPGYSFPYFGGNATQMIIPGHVVEKGFLLKYGGDAIFKASLAEPYSCIIGAFNASYHTDGDIHVQGTKKGGNLGILGGAGPMGLAALDYAINHENAPKFAIVTDLDDNKLLKAELLFKSHARSANARTNIVFVNPSKHENAAQYILSLTNHEGFDDIFVFAPAAPLLEMSNHIAGFDCCLNFFAGPTDPSFSVILNYYKVHYAGLHVVGTSGGSTKDIKLALEMFEQNLLHPEIMVTHIGGIGAIPEATLNLRDIPGGKKLIYLNKDFPLTSLEEIIKGDNQMYIPKAIQDILKESPGLWNGIAEQILLKN